LLCTFGVPATTTFAGSVSVKAIPTAPGARTVADREGERRGAAASIAVGANAL